MLRQAVRQEDNGSMLEMGRNSVSPFSRVPGDGFGGIFGMGGGAGFTRCECISSYSSEEVDELFELQ